jgi:hypothetical protein
MKASAQQDIPPAVFLGFCAKEYWAPAPDWWNATWTAHIQEVCSAGACLSKRPPAWVDRWDFNRASCWNDEAAAIACVPDELRDAFRVYAYRAMPLIFGGDALPRHLAVDQLFSQISRPCRRNQPCPSINGLGMMWFSMLTTSAMAVLRFPVMAWAHNNQSMHIACSIHWRSRTLQPKCLLVTNQSQGRTLSSRFYDVDEREGIQP